jgi:hypothetical protein
MRRRDFVIALGSVAAVSAPLLGRAQQAGKTYRIAIVSVAVPVAQMAGGVAHPFLSPLFEECVAGATSKAVTSWSSGILARGRGATPNSLLK